MAKCFVSFSSKDTDFVSKLLASLRLQEVEYWDYSDPVQDTPLGADLPSDLRRRIDGSDFFIAILTPASVDRQTGRFCIFEVVYARERQKPIIPVTLSPHLPPLGTELSFLVGRKYLYFAAEFDQSYEEAFEKLCATIGASYVPPFLGDPRIIFAPRFDKEIRNLDFSREHRADLRQIIDEFTRAYSDESWSAAHDAITFFILAHKRWVKGVIPYYPTILLALCQMHQDKLLEAAETLNQLKGHPLEDENLWGALGQIAFVQENYRDSLDKFKIARQKCPPGKDWEARFNVMAASVALGNPEEVSAAFDNLDLQDRPEDDRLKVANLQASWFLSTRQWKSAIVTLRDLIDRGFGDNTSVTYLSEAYEQSRQLSRAVELLSSEAKKRKALDLYHRLASLYAHFGQPVKALEVYEEHLIPHDQCRPWQITTDYALILRSIGYGDKARRVCEDALCKLEAPKAPGPETYFRGLAYYLLGRETEAKVFFVDSKSDQPYYARFA